MAFLRATEKVNSVNEEEELRKHGYIIGATLGEGSYAKVKAAYSERYNRKIALKIINKKKAPKEFLNKFLPRELDILKSVRHPNITQLYEILYFNNKVFICMELAGHGDLLDYVKLRGAIPEDRSRTLFTQLISAIQYIHGLNVIHRDLKCENILLDGSNNVKVSDFGFARVLMPGEMSKTFCGSAAYAAPEILQGVAYVGPAYDVWSCGVILYIMVCGSMPYDDSNIKKMIKFQTEKKVGFSKSKTLSQACKELIWIILDHNPVTRASIKAIFESSWMTPAPSHAQEQKASSSPPLPPPNHNGRVAPPQVPHGRHRHSQETEAPAPRPQNTSPIPTGPDMSASVRPMWVSRHQEMRPANPVPPPNPRFMDTQDDGTSVDISSHVGRLQQQEQQAPPIPSRQPQTPIRANMFGVSRFKRRFRPETSNAGVLQHAERKAMPTIQTEDGMNDVDYVDDDSNDH